MAIHFDIIRDGRKYSARADNGAAFPIAARVRYSPRHDVENYGLTNVGGNFGSAEADKHKFQAADYVGTYPYWSDFIEPTAICEGQSILSLNSYGRARFTFGFGQFAAHVPDGDFIRWFRDMLQRPEAQDYFPNFEVRNGRVFKLEALSATPMEDSQSTEPLMRYFNPSLGEVEDAEVIAAAKFVHWTANHAGARQLQGGGQPPRPRRRNR